MDPGGPAGQLAGRVALVTGAGRGFGRAIAIRLGQEGAAVALVSRSGGELARVAAEISGDGGQALAVTADVTVPAAVQRAVAETQDRLGDPTILVNNAGTPGPFGPVGLIDPEEWWQAQLIHQRAPLLFMSAVLPGMVAAGGGRIVNVAALAGVRVAAHMSAYCVGKGAEIRLTEHVAREGARHGIVAFAIEPGTVATQMARDTIQRADAQRWVPEMVARLRELEAAGSPDTGLARCAEMCLDLVSGRYDALSGRYLDVRDDRGALLRQALAAKEET